MVQRGGTRAWRKLAAVQRAKHLPCFICGQLISYDLEWPDPASFSADHIKPWVRHPELRLDPGNVVSSHLRCNLAKSDNEHNTPGMGALSENF